MLERVRRAGHWIAARLKDLFYGLGNENLDLARVIAGVFAGLAVFAIYWNAVVMRQAIDLSAAFTGLAALATAILGVAVKDWVRSKMKGGGE